MRDGNSGFRFERLSPAHDRSGFACEQPSLTDYLLKCAGQNERSDMAACFVALAPGSNRVVGYYTISAHAVLCDEIGRASCRERVCWIV